MPSSWISFLPISLSPRSLSFTCRSAARKAVYKISSPCVAPSGSWQDTTPCVAAWPAAKQLLNLSKRNWELRAQDGCWWTTQDSQRGSFKVWIVVWTQWRRGLTLCTSSMLSRVVDWMRLSSKQAGKDWGSDKSTKSRFSCNCTAHRQG